MATYYICFLLSGSAGLAILALVFGTFRKFPVACLWLDFSYNVHILPQAYEVIWMSPTGAVVTRCVFFRSIKQRSGRLGLQSRCMRMPFHLNTLYEAPWMLFLKDIDPGSFLATFM